MKALRAACRFWLARHFSASRRRDMGRRRELRAEDREYPEDPKSGRWSSTSSEVSV